MFPLFISKFTCNLSKLTTSRQTNRIHFLVKTNWRVHFQDGNVVVIRGVVEMFVLSHGTNATHFDISKTIGGLTVVISQSHGKVAFVKPVVEKVAKSGKRKKGGIYPLTQCAAVIK